LSLTGLSSLVECLRKAAAVVSEEPFRCSTLEKNPGFTHKH